jgi:hypothetical protein
MTETKKAGYVGKDPYPDDLRRLVLLGALSAIGLING